MRILCGSNYGTALPSPVKVSKNDELIWSSNTGRSTASGKMTGDVVAEKKTFTIEWGVLTRTQAQRLEQYLKRGFWPIRIEYGDGGHEDITAYRSTLGFGDVIEPGDGTTYFKSATCQLIEQ